MERSLVLIKPDGVTRGLIGRILQRFEDAGIKIVALKMVHVDAEHAASHYADVGERRGEKVLKFNVDFITSGPVVAFVLEGINAIENVRKMVGATEPKSSPPGTIRGDFAHVSYNWADEKDIVVKNLIHASSDEADAKREIALWFTDEEIHTYRLLHEPHTFGVSD